MEDTVKHKPDEFKQPFILCQGTEESPLQYALVIDSLIIVVCTRHQVSGDPIQDSLKLEHVESTRILTWCQKSNTTE